MSDAPRGSSGGLEPRITFFLAGERDLAALSRLDPDRDWRELVRGERAWPLQTFLELSRRGESVHLSDALATVPRVPGPHLVVFHAKQRRQVARQCRRRRDLTLVAIRADNSSPTIADFETVQNGTYADERRRFLIPIWPQAGMVRRDPERATRVRRLAYKGFAGNLHPDLRGERWRAFLAARGLEWEVDAVPFAKAGTDASSLTWNDYSEVDVVVALRPHSPTLHTEKPATKLFNAWLAGVPAIIGPEVACRELRWSPLDYIEASDLDEVETAVDRVRTDPALYHAMVENGRERARDFTADAIAARWREVLFERIPPLAIAPKQRRLQRLPLGLVAAGRRLRRFLRRKPAR